MSRRSRQRESIAPSEERTERGGGQRPGTGTAWKFSIRTLIVVMVVALGAAGWFGYAWWNASQATSTEGAQAREDALDAARDLAVTLQKVSPDRPEETLDDWEAAATGPLLEQLRRDRAKYLEQMRQAPASSFATVLDAALTELDVDAGTATAIAAIDVRSNAPSSATGPSGEPEDRELRVKLTLNRTEAGWKVASTDLIKA